MGLRLLLVGPPAAWLPGWRDGRLVVGGSAEADFSLGASSPDVLVQLLPEGAVLVRPLARNHAPAARAPTSELRDASGAPAPHAGLRVPGGGSFRIGAHVIVVADETPDAGPVVEGRACLICQVGVDPAQARTVAGVTICRTCTRRLDLPPGACPGYELLARVGVGGFGIVYLALQRALGRLVAVKAVRPTDDPERSGRAAHRLAREIRILAQLDHPAIVCLLDAVAAGPLTFLVSEFVRGGDARARLDRDGPFPAADVIAVGVSLAGALAYAHGRGVIHRDVKPENVLLGEDGQPRLVDFGLAKQLSGLLVPGTTASGAGLGSILYAAPEQLADARSAGPPADVWALAATLFHLATGVTPRQTERGSGRRGSLETLSLGKLLHATPARADEVSRHVPAALADALDAALAPDPAERPTAAAFGARLASLAGRSRP